MDFIRKSMTNKLILMFMAVSLIPIAIIGVFFYLSSISTIKTQLLNSLTNIAESREATIVHYLLGKSGRTVDFASDGFIRDCAKKLRNGDNEIVDSLNSHLIKNKKSLDKEICGINIIDLNGIVISSTSNIEIGLDESQQEYYLKTKELKYGNANISDVFLSNHFGANKISITSSAPLTDKNTGETLGILVNYYETTLLNEITTNREGMGKTGKTYLVNKKGYMITESRFTRDVVLRQRVDTEPVRLFQTKKEVMSGIYPDYRGVPIVGASMGDELEEMFELGWTFLVEIDVAEAFAPIKRQGLWMIVITIPIIIAVIIVACFIARRIAKPIINISEQVTKVGDGDLSVNISSNGRIDEIGTLSRASSKMIENLRDLTRRIQDSTNILASTANQLVTTVSQIATGSSETATAISETTTTAEEVKQTAHVCNQKAENVSANAQKAADISQNGKKSISDSLEAMNRIRSQMESIAESIVCLSEQSQAIGVIISTVNDLSEQSNLLAVNASIEAAKAGEHGKGFAVVALEVKSLAEQSKQATNHIQNILNDIQKATNNAVMSTEQGSKAVEAGMKQSEKAEETILALSNSIAEASQSSSQIAASSKQQLVGMDQVVLAMENIKQASDQNVDSTKQLETAARGLQDLGNDLKALMKQYKLE